MEHVGAHCHFRDPRRGNYHWLNTDPEALDPLRKVFSQGEPARQKVSRPVVVVHAAESVAETRHLLDLAEADPRIQGVVGWVDMADPASAATLRDLGVHPKFKGIRPLLQDMNPDDWIATRPGASVVQTVQDLCLRFDAPVQRRHLGPPCAFARAWPDLPLVVDHCATPQLSASGKIEPERADVLGGTARRFYGLERCDG